MNRKYTKIVPLLFFALGAITTVSAQVSQKVGTNPFGITSSAAFEIESTSKGFLPPRMSTGQRDAVSTAAKGLMVYNTDTNQLEVNTGTTTTPVWKAATVSNPAISVKTATYTAKESDYTILCDAGTLGFTLTLPLASTATGRVYVISKIDSTDNLLTFSPALNITKDVTVSNLNYARSFRVQSDGTSWNVID
jgi:hypothetical protein